MGFICVEKYLNDNWRDYLLKKNPHQTPEETLTQAEECLRFLSLCHLSCGSVPISQKIDDLWHLLILETKSYQALCQSLPGKCFIHHTSDDFPAQPVTLPLAEAAKRHLEWLVNYAKQFGPMEAHHLEYWPFARGLMAKLNLDLPQFQQKLRDLAHG